MATLKERIDALQRKAAQGNIRPEHQAELDGYIRQGVAKAPLHAKSIGPGTADPIDKKSLMEAQAKADTAMRGLRLYGDMDDAVTRFDPGPSKGMFYSAMMPDDDAGIIGNIGSTIGSMVRATGIMPKKTQDAWQELQAAGAERVGVRGQEQAGVEARNDEIQFKLADVSPLKSAAVNRKVIARARSEVQQDAIRADMEARWVSKYGSIANASPIGMTFNQALASARKRFAELQAKRKLPNAPPSAKAGGVVTYDLNGNRIK